VPLPAIAITVLTDIYALLIKYTGVTMVFGTPLLASNHGAYTRVLTSFWILIEETQDTWKKKVGFGR